LVCLTKARALGYKNLVINDLNFVIF